MVTLSTWKIHLRKCAQVCLEDGEFFWREDQNSSIEDLVANNVTFHEKIGSLSQHMAQKVLLPHHWLSKLVWLLKKGQPVACSWNGNLTSWLAGRRVRWIAEKIRPPVGEGCCGCDTPWALPSWQQTELFQRLRLVPSLRLQINWIPFFSVGWFHQGSNTLMRFCRAHNKGLFVSWMFFWLAHPYGWVGRRLLRPFIW